MEPLYQRGNVWWYRFTPPGGGKQVRGSTGTGDKKLAQEFYDKLKADSWRVAKLGEKPDRLWVEAATRWLEEKALKKRSIADDAGKLAILNPIMGGMKLSQIGNDYVREFIVKGVLRDRRVAPATVNRYVILISSVLNAARKEWGWLDVAPYLSRPGGAGERKREAWLTPDQFKRLAYELPEHTAALATFGVATGLREDNLIALTWRQVSMRHRYLVVPKEQFKGKRDHVVPLNNTAMGILEMQVGKHSARVFTYRGEPFVGINLRHWHADCDKVGINRELRESGMLGVINRRGVEVDERFVFHGLRHTFTTWLGHAGVVPEIRNALAGWAAKKEMGIGANYAHHLQADFLLPHSKKIDSILSGGILISTDLAQDHRTISAQHALTT